MRFDGRGFKLFFFVLIMGISSCAKDESPQPTNPATTPKINDSLSTAEREKYCFVRIESEAVTERQAFLDQLGGVWTHYPVDTHAKFSRREFRMDFNASIAAITTYEDYGHNVDDITYKKLCLSKPLDASYGAFAGYRLLEFMARDNAGAAALLVKIDRSADGRSSVLFLSDRSYTRFAAAASADPAAMIRTLEAEQIWIYRERK